MKFFHPDLFHISFWSILQGSELKHIGHGILGCLAGLGMMSMPFSFSLTRTQKVMLRDYCFSLWVGTPFSAVVHAV